MKKITCFVVFFLVFMVKEGKAQLLTQDFNAALTWTVGHPVGSSDNSGWTRETEGQNPTISTFEGAGMARFNSYSINVENAYDLTSPSIAFAGGLYRVSFKMYRDEGYAENPEKIEVFYNTTPTSVGGVLLGTVSRAIGGAPTVASAGWYTYNFNIPGNPNAPGYISFLATTAYGNNMYIDNVSVEVQPTCLPPTDFASTVTTNSANVSFTASTSSPNGGYQYELRTSGAAGSGATGLVTSGTQTGVSYPLNSLTPNTSYVFYARALCTATDNSSWESKSFKTLPIPPANDACSGAVTVLTNNNLDCTANVVSGTLLGATASGESTPTSIGVPDDDVWYKFTATSTFHRIALSDINGNPDDLVIEVLGGSCGGSLYNLAISDSNSFLVTDLTIGELYYVRIFSVEAASNPTTTFKICIGTPPPPPANDNCTGAVLLTTSATMTCTPVSGSTISATQSLEGCSGSADDDVWYKFVATSTVHSVLIANVAGATDIMIEAFDACGGTSLKCQDSPDDIMTLNELTVGNTYYFRIYTYYTDSTTSFTVCVVTPPPAPANDSPENAAVLTESPNSSCANSVAGTTVSAFHSSQYSCDSSAIDVWYTFTPASTGTYYFSRNLTGGTSGDGYISLYSGTPGNFTRLNDSCYSTTFSQALVAGTTYYVSVVSSDYSRVNFALCAFLAPPAPANDLIANAAVLTVSPDSLTCTNAVSGTTLAATNSSDYVCDSTATDVWYTFTPPTSGEYYFKRSVVSGSGNGYISIYSGTPGNLTRLNLNCYVTNFGQVLTAGTTYYVSVSASTSSYLSFSLCAYAAPPAPANDECQNATTLTAGGTFVQNAIVATNVSGTRNPASPDPTDVPSTCDTYNYSTEGRDVWFKVIAPASGTLTVETASNNDPAMTDTALYIYKGSSCATLTYVNCSADIGGGNNFSRVALSNLTPGETIVARVWGYSGTQGSFKIAAFDASLGTQAFSDASFKAYPNPVKNVLNLSYSQEMTSVAVFNLLGQQVLSKSLNNSNAQVDMSVLPQGTYLVKVMVDNQIKTIKIVKE